MNKHPEKFPEYMGLPVPDTQEYLALRFELFENIPEENLSINGLADAVKRMSPNINLVEAHDVRVWQQNESSPDFSENEVEQCIFGVQDGYDFAITCFTLLGKFRSEAKSMPEYLAQAPNLLGGLPVLSKEEYRRVIRVRTGRAPIDTYNPDRYVQDSTDLAANDIGDYMFEAGNMGKILEEQIENIYNNSGPDENDESFDETQAYVEGFMHGFENALQMYIQSYEEQVLQPLEEGLDVERLDKLWGHLRDELGDE